ncbi:MAG: histidine phosphatase family protein [Deltaproteobacteria bacterium]|nr:histidine phosphatase family protein [Deltaproteobacteria bacterium]
MTPIILVRHGRTPWNKDKIFRGTIDIPHDEVGTEEARLAGEWLRGETIHAAYASPLSRAMDTAQAIAGHHGLSVQALPGLIDLNYGDWQGVPLAEVKVKWADLYRQWETAPHTVRFPNGENLEECRARAWAAVEEAARRHPGQTVVLAAHRVVNKVLIAAFIGLDNSHFWRIGQDTTAINRFHLVDGVWHIGSINDICHLRSMIRGPYVDF